jgi:hypothetical protein
MCSNTGAAGYTPISVSTFRLGSLEMNTLIRLDFTSKQLEMDGSVLGHFTPSSKTEGTVELGTSNYTYVVKPMSYGGRIELHRGGRKVAVREYDFHDGVFSLRVGNDVVFDLDKEILYNTKGRAGKVVFTESDLIMEFNSLVPAESLGLVAALVALDTMWANMVGLTRTRAQPAAPE